MSERLDTWRVKTSEGVFETDLETLRQWISEGCVLPTDKVSKGNFSWIEAQRAPLLRGVFLGEPVGGDEMPASAAPFESTQNVAQAPNISTSFQSPAMDLQPDDGASFDPTEEHSIDESDDRDPLPLPSANAVCHNHPDAPARFVCSACRATFCGACPTLMGSSVRTCPLCGEFCDDFREELKRIAQWEFKHSGFGFSDFGRAIVYPTKHLVALICGAILYAFLHMGGFKGAAIASAIMFGCMTRVISHVAWGRLHRSFMPDMSEFSMLDDFLGPLKLGLGVTLISWGPAIALIAALVFGAVSTTRSMMQQRAAAIQAGQEERLTNDDMSALTDPEADPQKLEEANRKLQDLRPGSEIAREAERSQKELSDPTSPLKQLAPMLAAGAGLLILLLVAFVWGIFYYPMALTVAGYSERFRSVINPLVGLDTIRRMGFTYFKAFFMVIAVQIAGFFVSIVVAIILSPFAMPLVGNLPANFVGGIFAFYFNLVIACTLGLALHKSADKLGIETD